MIDAVVTLITWLPVNIVTAIILSNNGIMENMSHKAFITMYHILYILYTVKCISTPIVYYATNSSFRVSIYIKIYFQLFTCRL